MKNNMHIDDFLSGKKKIEKPDQCIYEQVKRNWDKLAKPLDSLGKFEDITARIGAIHGNAAVDISKKAVAVMCADNGIVAENVSQTGQEVTLAVARAMAEGSSSVCKMAAGAGIDVFAVDVGIASDELVEGLVNKKMKKGTCNFAKEPAMTIEEAKKAVDTGIEISVKLSELGYRLICTGEMGIGNTTTSAAVIASLLKEPADIIAGRGSGLCNEALKRKRLVIKNAIDKYDLYNANPIEVTAYAGGFDIAALAGLIIGAAYCKIPIVLDGVISLAAALAAVKLIPMVRDYLIASHISREPAAGLVLKELMLSPVIDADMALGEGTGAVMLCVLLDTALALYNTQLTFDDINIEAYSRFEEEAK